MRRNAMSNQNNSEIKIIEISQPQYCIQNHNQNSRILVAMSNFLATMNSAYSLFAVLTNVNKKWEMTSNAVLLCHDKCNQTINECLTSFCMNEFKQMVQKVECVSTETKLNAPDLTSDVAMLSGDLTQVCGITSMCIN
ncbi:CLUMA_CG003496, isoform A [Clunio marinus]|uniref:CLUMA_CG003496, isoform A n=1 Tax=Clunio marinus TaxID=568069 RepID=A0A1J1HQY8_9DIPT|nr:CLUMA_CG003496, isoform A [Clunio marinus]